METKVADEKQRAFVASIAAEHGRRLRRFLASRLRNRADASDIAQEVYLRLLRVEETAVIRSPEAYLFTVASHLLYEHTLRQANAPVVVEFEDLATEGPPERDEDPVARAQMQQRVEALERVIARLSPRAQATLVLHRRDGFSLEEIGARLGISRNTVKKHLAKALLFCRKRLESE